jgi:hypothetical protein
MHAVDSNLLDPDIQGIKRKLDQDDRDLTSQMSHYTGLDPIELLLLILTDAVRHSGRY